MRIAALAFALVAFASAGLAVPLDPRQITNICPIPGYTAPPNPQHMVGWQEAGVEWPSGSQIDIRTRDISNLALCTRECDRVNYLNQYGKNKCVAVDWDPPHDGKSGRCSLRNAKPIWLTQTSPRRTGAGVAALGKCGDSQFSGGLGICCNVLF